MAKFEPVLAATERLVAAGKDATPQMAAEASNLLGNWLQDGKALSDKRWADIAARYPAGRGAQLLERAKLPKGMTVGKAALGAVAIGGGIYLASKLFSKPKAPPPNWADRIVAERAAQRPLQR